MGDDESVQLTLAMLMKRNKVTQRQIAFALDIRQSTVSDWNTRKHTPRLKPSETRKLLNLLGCTLDELVEAFEGPVEPQQN